MFTALKTFSANIEFDRPAKLHSIFGRLPKAGLEIVVFFGVVRIARSVGTIILFVIAGTQKINALTESFALDRLTLSRLFEDIENPD